MTQKNNFESQNFEMFEEVVHNFGKYDLVKSRLFPLDRSMVSCQLAQKFLDGFYYGTPRPVPDVHEAREATATFWNDSHVFTC